MGFAVDGFNSAVSPNFSASTASLGVTLTTSNSCVVWAAVYNLGFSKHSIAPSTITDNSGQSLTWVQAAGVIADSSNHGYLELWYAKTSAPFSGVTITATFATATETAAIIVWGEDGIGNTVLDPSASLPIQSMLTSNSTNKSFTTNNGADVGFFVVGFNGVVPSISAGWTQIAYIDQPSPKNYNTQFAVWYQTFTSPQASLSVTVSSTGGSSQSGAVLAAAAQAAVVSATRAQSVLVGF
jgi:hypothetical protein